MTDCGEDHVISIHAPREGSDQVVGRLILSHKQFLSTLPARGATIRQKKFRSFQQIFLSTLPARGATLINNAIVDYSTFLSTLPARGATHPIELGHQHIAISIHAPREGSDRLKG